jgi:hypothetical protein
MINPPGTQPAPAPQTTPPPQPPNNPWMRTVLILVVLGLGLYVALVPNLVYAPTPRIVLFFILSVIPAILFGSEVSSRFNVTLPGFVFAVAGAGAVFFGSLFLLDFLSKPEEKIAVFTFRDENGNDLRIDAPDMLQISLSNTALPVSKFTEGSTLVVIFPEQVGEVNISIVKITGDKPYRGKIGYAGTRKMDLQLGKDLIQ